MDLRIFTEPQQGASYEDLLAVAQTAERVGFSAFFRSDHYLKMGDASGLPGPTHAWVTLAGLARETSTIRLGTLVSPVTFHQPGALAIMVAQVDAMSGGRVDFGFGAGWYEAEHTAYGLDFGASMGERIDRMEEALEQMVGLWTTPAGATFTHEGRFASMIDAPGLPKPTQQPHPPIIIGGKGPKRTPAMVARYAAEYNVPFVAPSEQSLLIERVQDACRAIDRDPAGLALSAAVVVCVGADEAEVERRAAAIGREPGELRANGVAGTVDEVVDRIGTYTELGLDRLYLQILDLSDLDHLELIAAEVMPRVG